MQASNTYDKSSRGNYALILGSGILHGKFNVKIIICVKCLVGGGGGRMYKHFR
jgi:hypothetical protein